MQLKQWRRLRRIKNLTMRGKIIKKMQSFDNSSFDLFKTNSGGILNLTGIGPNLAGWGTLANICLFCFCFYNPQVNRPICVEPAQCSHNLADPASVHLRTEICLMWYMVLWSYGPMVPCALCYEAPRPKKLFSRFATLTWNVVNSWSLRGGIWLYIVGYLIHRFSMQK